MMGDFWVNPDHLFCPTCGETLYKLVDFPIQLVATMCPADFNRSCDALADLGMYAYCGNRHLFSIEYRKGCGFCKTPPTEPIIKPKDTEKDPGAEEFFQRHLLVNLLRHQTIPAAFAGGALFFWPCDDDEETQ